MVVRWWWSLVWSLVCRRRAGVSQVVVVVVTGGGGGHWPVRRRAGVGGGGGGAGADCSRPRQTVSAHLLRTHIENDCCYHMSPLGNIGFVKAIFVIIKTVIFDAMLLRELLLQIELVIKYMA